MKSRWQRTGPTFSIAQLRKEDGIHTAILPKDKRRRYVNRFTDSSESQLLGMRGNWRAILWTRYSIIAQWRHSAANAPRWTVTVRYSGPRIPTCPPKLMPTRINF